MAVQAIQVVVEEALSPLKDVDMNGRRRVKSSGSRGSAGSELVTIVVTQRIGNTSELVVTGGQPTSLSVTSTCSDGILHDQSAPALRHF